MGSYIAAEDRNWKTFSNNAINMLMNGREKISKNELRSQLFGNFSLDHNESANIDKIENLDGEAGFSLMELKALFALAYSYKDNNTSKEYTMSPRHYSDVDDPALDSHGGPGLGRAISEIYNNARIGGWSQWALSYKSEEEIVKLYNEINAYYNRCDNK